MIATFAMRCPPPAGACVYPNAGILSHYVHSEKRCRASATWVRAFAGRMKSDFSISPSTVYFTFPFVQPVAAAMQRLENAAQDVLNVRDSHPDESLADLYDPLAMPRDLRKAHDRLDAVIDGLYRLKKPSEAERLSRLGAEYAALAAPLEKAATRRTGKR
jgi:hypothetical protein